MAKGTALDVVRQAYEALGRGDVEALLNLMAPEAAWRCVKPATLPYGEYRRLPQPVADCLTNLPQANGIDAFEPRQFIQAGEQVTVLGWEKTAAVRTPRTFELEWVHVLTVNGGKITHWRGFFYLGPRVEVGKHRFGKVTRWRGCLEASARHGASVKALPDSSIRNAHPDA